MKIQNLDEQVSISSQVTENDLDKLSHMGIEVLVCNRPDGEARDQPDVAMIKQKAEQSGISVVTERYVPITAKKGTSSIAIPKLVSSNDNLTLMVLIESDDLDITGAAKTQITS